MAKTRLLVANKPAPGEEHVQLYHVSETLDEVISAYRAANPKTFRRARRAAVSSVVRSSRRRARVCV